VSTAANPALASQDTEQVEADALPETKSKKVHANKPNKIAKTTNKAEKTWHRTHSVQEGDTLWNIARRYEGLTVQRLMKLNGLHDKTLKVGQKLIVG
jgi:membrane-bound lytic murein transglycosylase D